MKEMIINEKPLMWYKVNELSEKMNKTQVGICLGIHRETVQSENNEGLLLTSTT